MYLGRMVRRYRSHDPELSKDLAQTLRTKAPTRPDRLSGQGKATPIQPDGSLSVLRATTPSRESAPAPVLSLELESTLFRLLQERLSSAALEKHGLSPASSAVFVGPPGVGKTRSAQWIAAELDLPLFSLDLTAVMSSRLGQSGANLRYALDKAKAEPSVLFLDELDAIAKRRDDDSDVGELKRLVTIMLQELDDWPSTSLLLAATNHPAIVDPALWRRFDMVVTFTMPEGPALVEAITRFIGDDTELMDYVPTFQTIFEGMSFSEVERRLLTIRKQRILTPLSIHDVVADAVQGRTSALTTTQRASLAAQLAGRGALSQRKASELLGVSRDTIRKVTRSTTNVGGTR